jgi:hypothetical protein
MRTLPLLLLAAVVSGCIPASSIAPEAEPFVAGAYAGGDGLVEYLTASDVDVLDTEEIERVSLLRRIQAERGVMFDLSGGGRCAVYTYASANEARQFGPQRTVPALIPEEGVFEPSAVQLRYQQPVQFGPSVVFCRGADARTRNAFLALRDAYEGDA